MSTSRVYEGSDVIDSRDVIERIGDLESERVSAVDAADPYTAEERKARGDEWDDSEDGQEFVRLKSLQDQAEGSPDWTHGEALISESYFAEYAQELAEDIGAIGKDLPWPACHIDWDAAADALKQDYTSVEYGETTYWIRS